MKKILLMLCALSLCLLTACFDFCGATHLEATTVYEFHYTNPDGTTTSDEFTTNEYGQASFPVPDNVECSRVTINKKVREAMEETLWL